MASFLGQVRDVWRQASHEVHEHAHHHDPEKAAGSLTPGHGHGHGLTSPGSGYFGSGPDNHATHIHPRNARLDTDPNDDRRLELFRLMLGITSTATLLHSDESPRPADNIGLYTRIVKAETNCKKSYKIFSLVINTCYVLQIVIAAALTALGAANANNKAITAFGAINTVIAGFLTYLKGSGLPARLKYFGDEWKKIREFIEQRERDFSHSGCTLDVDEEVQTIYQMYAHTKRDVELNTPDSFSSPTRASNTADAVGLVPGAVKDKIAGIDASKIEGVLGHLKGLDPAKIDDLMHKLRSIDGTVQDLKQKMDDKSGEVRDAFGRLRDKGDEVREAVTRQGDEVRDTVGRLRDRGTEVRDNVTRQGEEVRDAMGRLHEDERAVEAGIRRMGKTVSDAF